jgi:periplasmic divalent cation tolerance protein
MNNAATDYLMVYVTTGTRPEAESIAEALVRDRLAACVNVLGEVQSIYRWQGQVEKSAEVVLIAKTRAALFDEVRDKVKAMHSADVPCIVAYPMVDGFGPYLEWITIETGGLEN